MLEKTPPRRKFPKASKGKRQLMKRDEQAAQPTKRPDRERETQCAGRRTSLELLTYNHSLGE
jgi:hypothetical protein